MPKTDPQKEYVKFDEAYERLNERLFEGLLPKCIITFQHEAGCKGYFWQDKFRRRKGASTTSEIALNPDVFSGRSDRQILSTLLHEMVHLWQAEFGKPGRGGYHNKKWAEKMKLVGLMPSSTGRPGGFQTGDSITHYVIPNGRFAEVFRELRAEGFRLAWESRIRYRDPSRNKVKFSCAGCKLNVWGAETVEGRLACIGCGLTLQRPS